MNLLILNQSLFQNLSKGILLIAKHSVRHKVLFANVLCCGALCVCSEGDRLAVLVAANSSLVHRSRRVRYNHARHMFALQKPRRRL